MAGGRLRRPRTGPPALSAQEERVAALVATGITNAAIARQLSLSVSTTETSKVRPGSKGPGNSPVPRLTTPCQTMHRDEPAAPHRRPRFIRGHIAVLGSLAALAVSGVVAGALPASAAENYSSAVLASSPWAYRRVNEQPPATPPGRYRTQARTTPAP
jgi:hypothetical protein